MKKKFLAALERIKNNLSQIKKQSRNKHPTLKKGFFSFDESKESYLKGEIANSISYISSYDAPVEIAKLFSRIKKEYETEKLNDLPSLIDGAIMLVSQMEEKNELKIPILPEEIREEISADISEMKKCIEAQCYRSATILCGRILETALHRKYYDLTGTDILETAPGIGLGKLIAKLSEKHFSFEPGMTEQIHLINQVRIGSVHKKTIPFSPSKEQAQAMMLYTMDVLAKLFSKKR